MTDRTTPALDLVPLAARIHHLQWLRAGVIAVAATWSLVAPPLPGYDRPWLALVGYGALAAVAEAYWRLAPGRGRMLLDVMLLADGLVLAWAPLATGGWLSPLWYLTLVHVGAVALLASYRTGCKVALWHSLLLVTVVEAQGAGLLPSTGAPGPGNAEHLRLGAVLVALWAIALTTSTFSAVNERELRRRRYDLEALSRLADDMERVTDSSTVADRLLEHLCGTFGFDRGLVLRLSGTVVVPLSAWPDRGGVDTAGRTLTSPLVSRVCRERRAHLVDRLAPGPESDLTRLLPAARHVLTCPLRVDGSTIGVVMLEYPHARLPWRTLTMVERFCDHGALAIENARLLEQLRAMASTDGLTGLRNRRDFDASIRQELERSSRSGAPCSLALIDIDHFKQLNDTHGHQAGDDVLREVAHLLRDACRAFDVVARYGGEEFAVILPDTDGATAGEVAERLRRRIAEGATTVPVTVSVGVATTTRTPPGGPASLVAAADRALYEAKRGGRNRVRTEAETMAVGPAGVRAQEVA